MWVIINNGGNPTAKFVPRGYELASSHKTLTFSSFEAFKKHILDHNLDIDVDSEEFREIHLPPLWDKFELLVHNNKTVQNYLETLELRDEMILRLELKSVRFSNNPQLLECLLETAPEEVMDSLRNLAYRSNINLFKEK